MEKSNDEGVNLKMLQTALTLLQGPGITDSEVCDHKMLDRSQLARAELYFDLCFLDETILLWLLPYVTSRTSLYCLQ